MFFFFKKIEAETDTTQNVFLRRCTIFRLAKPAFFRYSVNFTSEKAGLACRNIVQLHKKTFYVVSVSASIFFIAFVKAIRSLY